MNAKELKSLSESKMLNFDEAIKKCKEHAEHGFTFKIFFDKVISPKGIEELMRNGFTIGTSIMPDGIEFQKVCW